jgi:hypothetical protein
MKSLLYLALLTTLVSLRSPVPAPNPIITNPCKLFDGKPRPFPCEFQIHSVSFVDNNGKIVAQSNADKQPIKLLLSQAGSLTLTATPGVSATAPNTFTVTSATSAESVMRAMYNVRLNFTRINKPSFQTPAYALSLSDNIDPASAGQTAVVNKTIQVSPNLPPPLSKGNQVSLAIRLDFKQVNGKVILVDPTKLLLLQNPTTVIQTAKTIAHFRDRAEAWRILPLSVDVKH